MSSDRSGTRWQIKWQIIPAPPENSNFRFILIDVSSESSGRPGGISNGRSYPPENSNFRFILIDEYSESSGMTRWQILPLPRKQQFHIHTDRCILLRSQAHQVADQVADLTPPQKTAISDSY